MNLMVQKSKPITAILTLLMVLAFSFSFTGVTSYAVFDENFNVGGTGEVNAQAADDQEGAFTKIIDKYKNVITFVSGLAAVTMVGVFIFNFTKLGTTSTNPSERQKVITGLIFSGIAAALLGSVSLIVGVFYGFLK